VCSSDLQLGIQPATSISGPAALADETVFHSGYREWLRLMKAGFARAGQLQEKRAG
jgi:hypothetical protein